MLKLTLIEAAGNLLAYRQRSVLALIGILIGAGAVIAMINVGAMAQNETVKQFQQMGIDILSIRSSRSSGMTLAEVQALTTATQNLTVVAPFTGGSAIAVFGGAVLNPPVIGVTEGFGRIARLRPREGRFISALDRFELFCVLGSKVADDLSRLGTRVHAGSDLRIGRYLFRVLSILEPVTKNPMLSVDVNDSIFMSIPNARRVVASANIGQVLARMRPGANPSIVSSELTAYFRSRPQGSDLEVESAQQLIDAMADQMRLFQLLLGAIGGIALVLGGVGVMNIMLISVQERHQEIGIRLAIGARRLDVQTLFLSEAVILAVLGGLLGIGLGIAGSYGFAKVSGWDFVISPVAAPLGAGVSIAVGIFFGFYPAYMAARLDPIVALRSE